MRPAPRAPTVPAAAVRTISLRPAAYMNLNIARDIANQEIVSMKKRKKYPDSKAECFETEYEDVYAGPELPDDPEPELPEDEEPVTRDDESPAAPDIVYVERAAYAGPAMLVYGGPAMMVYGGPDYFRNRSSGMSGFAGIDLSQLAQKSEENNETEAADPDARYCAECGAKLLPGAKFCIECGTKVEVPET